MFVILHFCTLIFYVSMMSLADVRKVFKFSATIGFCYADDKGPIKSNALLNFGGKFKGNRIYHLKRGNRLS